MRSKLQILFFFTTFLSIVNCGCKTGYFTKIHACDTLATLIRSSKFASIDIAKGKWHYYYLPLKGLGETFGLTFKMDGSPLDVLINFQGATKYTLPTTSYSDYSFKASSGDRSIPLSILTYGMQNRDNGKMLLGIYNSDSVMRNVQIRYYKIDEDPKAVLTKLVMTISLVVIAILCAIFLLGVYIRRVRVRRAARRMQMARLDSESQGVLLVQSPLNQNNVKSPNVLTLEEFQKYFPPKSFEKLENPFQQAGCSVCLEDFSEEILCYQLYCNHIFHEGCIQQWLEKQNSCPACRVPLGRKAIEEFLKKQENQNEVNIPETIDIQIQGQEVTDEQGNNHQIQP